jgi:hypothetical protein
MRRGIGGRKALIDRDVGYGVLVTRIPVQRFKIFGIMRLPNRRDWMALIDGVFLSHAHRTSPGLVAVAALTSDEQTRGNKFGASSASRGALIETHIGRNLRRYWLPKLSLRR